MKKPVALMFAMLMPIAAMAEESVPEADVQRARAAVMQMKKELTATLEIALEHGPEAAIGACRVEAPAIAARASKPGLTVGRTSHKLRNPKNAPEAWMKPLLARFRAAPPQPGSYKAVKLDDGSTGYVEPIYVQSQCLVCHGASIPPSVTEALVELYPTDQATGFETDDFRGLFWAKAAPRD